MDVGGLFTSLCSKMRKRDQEEPECGVGVINIWEWARYGRQAGQGEEIQLWQCFGLRYYGLA